MNLYPEFFTFPIFCHAHPALFWREDRKLRFKRYVFLLLCEHEMFLLEVHKPLLYAVSVVFRAGKTMKVSRVGKQFAGILVGVKFLRENYKKIES